MVQINLALDPGNNASKIIAGVENSPTIVKGVLPSDFEGVMEIEGACRNKDGVISASFHLYKQKPDGNWKSLGCWLTGQAATNRSFKLKSTTHEGGLKVQSVPRVVASVVTLLGQNDTAYDVQLATAVLSGELKQEILKSLGGNYRVVWNKGLDTLAATFTMSINSKNIVPEGNAAAQIGGDILDALTVDMGHGTTITSLREGSLKAKRRVLSIGVASLYEDLSKDRDVILAANSVGDAYPVRAKIAKAIESSGKYGKVDISKAIARHSKSLGSVYTEIIKDAMPDEGCDIFLIGGGSELPEVQKAVSEFNPRYAKDLLHDVSNSRFVNAEMLYRKLTH